MRGILVNSLVIGMVSALPALAQSDKKTPPFDPFTQIEPSALKVDVPAFIHVRSAADVKRVRQELIAFIWKSDRLPTSSNVERAETTMPSLLTNSAATAESLTVKMDKGFKSEVFHLRPAKPNGRLAIFHQGHDTVWTGRGAETAKYFLDHGFSVLAFEMPLYGANKQLGPSEIKRHNDMAKLVAPDLEPIRFFLEPVAITLNYALETFKYTDVVMVGLSGGGWTTTLYAAIDPRVRLSFPVAGTLPQYLRVADRDKGDWEQYYPDLYKVANYLDLYVLGSTGAGRKQRQVLNQFDSCCFAGVGYQTYEKHVQAAVGQSGLGGFDVYLDSSHRSHVVSPDALERAIGPLLEEPRPK